MVQPLAPVEASKIDEVAKLLSQEFQAARKQIESVRRCLDLSRAKDYDGAMAAGRSFPTQAREGLTALQQFSPYGEQLEKAVCK